MHDGTVPHHLTRQNQGVEAPDTQRFQDLGRPRRIWAIAAVHGEAGRLAAIHREVWDAIRPGDRLIYLGNLLGRGSQIAAVIDDALHFRRQVIGRPGMIARDVVFLRGMQEEMWQKLLQLQLAPNPIEVLNWMQEQGVAPTLAAYGSMFQDGLTAARGGATHIARWTLELRQRMRQEPGHDSLMTDLKRAAFVANGTGSALFVSAGLDPSRPLAAQGDRFWWAGSAITRLDRPYETFQRVIRGYDPSQGGLNVGAHLITLDAGCGFNGPLICALMDAHCNVEQLIEA